GTGPQYGKGNWRALARFLIRLVVFAHWLHRSDVTLLQIVVVTVKAGGGQAVVDSFVQRLFHLLLQACGAGVGHRGFGDVGVQLAEHVGFNGVLQPVNAVYFVEEHTLRGYYTLTEHRIAANRIEGVGLFGIQSVLLRSAQRRRRDARHLLELQGDGGVASAEVHHECASQGRNGKVLIRYKVVACEAAAEPTLFKGVSNVVGVDAVKNVVIVRVVCENLDAGFSPLCNRLQLGKVVAQLARKRKAVPVLAGVVGFHQRFQRAFWREAIHLGSVTKRQGQQRHNISAAYACKAIANGGRRAGGARANVKAVRFIGAGGVSPAQGHVSSTNADLHQRGHLWKRVSGAEVQRAHGCFNPVNVDAQRTIKNGLPHGNFDFGV